MPCYSPIHGYRKKYANPSGKFGFTTSIRDAKTSQPLTIPCGYCIGCRLEKSRQWAMRCVHEAQLHKKNCFITLTFNNDALKSRKTNSLLKRDFQLFIKRLRKHFNGQKIRYYQCGEYGDRFKRPHYHACIFGEDFSGDRTVWKSGLYRSKTLESLWPFGFSTIGECTFESAAYVARYVTKKIYGKNSLEHYTKFDKNTGEILEELQPEYTSMSRRPGIGRGWIEKYTSDVYPKDFVHVRGKKSKPVRYYDKYLESVSPGTLQKVKAKRKRCQVQLALDKSRPSLESQERCAHATLKNKKRSFENGST